MSDLRNKCSVRDGRFVEPCDTLAKATDNPHGTFGRAKGIVCWNYTNMTTHEPSRTFFGIRTNEFGKGIAFNCCPFCGERIDQPFNPDEAEPQP